MVMSSRSALFLSRGWLSKSYPVSVVMSIRNGFNLPFCPLALSRKGHVSSTINWTLLSRRDGARAWWRGEGGGVSSELKCFLFER